MIKRIALAAALTLATLTPTHAADINVFLSKGGDWYLTLKGTIDITDGITMRSWASVFKSKGITDVTVMLDSPGGNVLGGLGVAATIWANDWDTLIGDGTTCASMCADIWLAGKSRYAYSTSKIGMHSAGRKVGKAGKVRMLRGDNSLRVKFYKKFGLSTTTIAKMIAPNPDDMMWLDADKAAELGIDYVVLGDKKPAAAVTPNTVITTKVSGSGCPDTQVRVNLSNKVGDYVCTNK
jgi:ATP-dependent protease ClpP protease subunit